MWQSRDAGARELRSSVGPRRSALDCRVAALLAMTRGEASGRAGTRLATFVTPGSTRGPAAFVPRGSTPAGAPPGTNPSPRHCEPPQAARQSMTEACRPAPTQSLSRDVTRSIASPLRSSQRGKRDPGSSPGRRGGQSRTGLPMPRGYRSTGGRLLLFCTKSCLSANDPVADVPHKRLSGTPWPTDQHSMD